MYDPSRTLWILDGLDEIIDGEHVRIPRHLLKLLTVRCFAWSRCFALFWNPNVLLGEKFFFLLVSLHMYCVAPCIRKAWCSDRYPRRIFVLSHCLWNSCRV